MPWTVCHIGRNLLGVSTTPLQKKFGKTVRTLREERGISQEDLALIAGLDRSFMGKLERGITQPSLKKIFQIAEALRISPSYLIKKVEQGLK